MNKYVQVVQVPTLAEFQAEVPVGNDGSPVVRLNISESWVPGQIPQKRVNVDLYGVNGQGEIVWLHDSHLVLWAQNKPMFGRDTAIYEGMGQMYDLVKAYLKEQGYEVRGGRYGIPNSIDPLRGAFECVRWVKEGEESFRVEAATSAGVGAQTVEEGDGDV
jgi:hypothetical protein